MSADTPRLLIVSGIQGDTRRYRTFHLYEQARIAGLICDISHLTDPQLRMKAQKSSTIILHRAPYDGNIAWLESEARLRKLLLINDLDDLVFDPSAVRFIHSPDFADTIRLNLYLEDVRRNRKTLDISTHVFTSCEYLARLVVETGKPVSVHRNAFSLEMAAYSERAYLSHRLHPGKIVIGYASGTHTHDQDFALVKPALKSVLSRHPEAELHLVGRLDPGNDWGTAAGRIKRIPFMPWRKLPEIQAQFDINLAPLLIDNPFGQSKSEIKYVEAGLVRVPTIASPSESYTFAIRDGENGFLAGSAKDWHHHLEALITDPSLRSRMGELAYQDVLDRYSPAARARELVELLQHITGNPLETHLPGQFNQPLDSSLTFWSSRDIEKSPTFIERGFYSLRYRSLRTLLQQVWIYFRRLVSPIFPFPKPR